MNTKSLKFLRDPIDPTVEVVDGFIPLDTVVDFDFDKFYKLPPYKGRFPTRIRTVAPDPALGVTDPEEIKIIKNNNNYIRYLETVDLASAESTNKFIAFIKTDVEFNRFLKSGAYKRYISSSAYKEYLNTDVENYFNKESHVLFMKYLSIINDIRHKIFMSYQESPEYLTDKEKILFNNDYTGDSEYIATNEYALYLEQVNDLESAVATPSVIKVTTDKIAIEWEAESES